MNFTSKHEIITEDEIDINVDDDDDPYDKSFINKTEGINKFSFSISNILSDSFGPKPVKIEPNQTNDKNTIFRPFEFKNFISNSNSSNIAQNPSSVFLSNFRLSEIFNSTKHAASPQSKSDNSLRNSLYNSLASYPKIHEEILNSHKKYSTNTQMQHASSNFHTTTKIPPLGGLCKTISQIGQENFTQSSLSSSTPSALSSTQSKSNLSDSLKIQQSSTDSIDSDDCTSEASGSKDETKMWPAWVSVILKLYFNELIMMKNNDGKETDE
jgi:hypothetical protein